MTQFPEEKKLTVFQRLRFWFWTSRLGLALQILLGNPVGFRLDIEGTILVSKSNMSLKECNVTTGGSNIPVDLEILKSCKAIARRQHG